MIYEQMRYQNLQSIPQSLIWAVLLVWTASVVEAADKSNIVVFQTDNQSQQPTDQRTFWASATDEHRETQI